MTPAASVYLALAVEAPDADGFAVYAAKARGNGARVADVHRAKRAWHLARTYRHPLAGVAR